MATNLLDILFSSGTVVPGGRVSLENRVLYQLERFPANMLDEIATRKLLRTPPGIVATVPIALSSGYLQELSQSYLDGEPVLPQVAHHLIRCYFLQPGSETLMLRDEIRPGTYNPQVQYLLGEMERWDAWRAGTDSRMSLLGQNRSLSREERLREIVFSAAVQEAILWDYGEAHSLPFPLVEQLQDQLRAVTREHAKREFGEQLPELSPLAVSGYSLDDALLEFDCCFYRVGRTTSKMMDNGREVKMVWDKNLLNELALFQAHERVRITLKPYIGYTEPTPIAYVFTQERAEDARLCPFKSSTAPQHGGTADVCSAKSSLSVIAPDPDTVAMSWHPQLPFVRSYARILGSIGMVPVRHASTDLLYRFPLRQPYREPPSSVVSGNAVN